MMSSHRFAACFVAALVLPLAFPATNVRAQTTVTSERPASFTLALMAALWGVVARAQTTVTSVRPATFTLPNGMQVVVIPDHRTPVVTQMIWYKVGSADETPGKSGLAHFLEHLMLERKSVV